MQDQQTRQMRLPDPTFHHLSMDRSSFLDYVTNCFGGIFNAIKVILRNLINIEGGCICREGVKVKLELKVLHAVNKHTH